MLGSHRVDFGKHMAAARAARVSYNTARKAFQRGFGPSMPAIVDVIREEQREARLLLSDEQAEEDLRRTAVRQLAKENVAARVLRARALRIARANSLAELAMAGNLLHAGLEWSPRLAALLDEWDCTPSEGVAVARVIIEINKAAVATATKVDAMERRILGEPSVAEVPAPELTVEKAIATLVQGRRSLERLERTSTLRATFDLDRRDDIARNDAAKG